MTRIRLQQVEFMPKELEQGVLYVSEEYHTAAHLCACGCGVKVRTPLGPTEWSFVNTPNGPSLFPSIGNWQQPCQSHYWINKGQIRWANQWTPKQILAGREAEQTRRANYYNKLSSQKEGALWGIWMKAKDLLGKFLS